MFAAFDGEDEQDEVIEVTKPKDSKKDKKKKKKNKKASKKRDAEEEPAVLKATSEKEAVGTSAEAKRVKLSTPVASDDEEDLAMAEQEAGGAAEEHVGYDEDDYVVETKEYENCTHEYVAPKSYVRPDFKRPLKRAKEYKFRLDTFQNEATKCIERGESVLVAAHTSAGKTAIAEYAIAQSL